ncbi:MAG: hypothetical protein KBH06_08440 [Spirochaetes bacterium]|nr:hypothetical protein [Spirochaetota bacterium]
MGGIKTFYVSCVIISFFLFSFIFALSTAILYFAGSMRNFVFHAGYYEILYLTGAFLLFTFIFIAKVKKNTSKDFNTLKKRSVNFGMFIVSAGVYALAVFLIDRISSSAIERPVQIPLYIAVGFLFSFASYHYFKSSISIFMNNIIINYHLSLKGMSDAIKSSVVIYSNAQSVLNYCKRFDLSLSLFAVKIGKIKLKKGTFSAADKDISKKVSFLLADISRNYEPWYFDKSGDILFSFLQVKNKTDYQIASKRYSSALSENKFLYDTEDYSAEIYFAGELFTSGELNFPIYENAAKDYLKNAITGITTQLKRIR